MLRSTDWPLPPAFDQAYNESEILVFEANISQMYKTDFQMKLMQQAQLPDGVLLKSLLSPEVYNELTNYCANNNVSVNAFQRLKPSFVIVSLAQLELQKLGVTQGGVDLHYLKRAQVDAKTVDFFETPEFQIKLLCSLGEGKHDDCVRYFLNEIKSSAEVIHKILAYWRSGNREGLDTITNEQMRKTFPTIYKQMLFDRNQKWMPKILKYFETDTVEYVLVGAAHLVGEDGLLKQLDRQGFKLTQLSSRPKS